MSLFVFHLPKTNKIGAAAIMMEVIRETVIKQNLTHWNQLEMNYVKWMFKLHNNFIGRLEKEDSSDAADRQMEG